MNESTNLLFAQLKEKSLLKQDVYRKTLSAFKQFRDLIFTISNEYAEFSKQNGSSVPFHMKEVKNLS